MIGILTKYTKNYEYGNGVWILLNLAAIFIYFLILQNSKIKFPHIIYGGMNILWAKLLRLVQF